MIYKISFTSMFRKISSLLVISIFLLPSIVSALPLSPDDIKSLEDDTVFFKSDYDKEVGPTVSCGGGSSFSPSKNAQDIWTFLTSAGRMTPWGAAAIMGNISHEAPDFNTRLVEFGYLNSRGQKSVQGDNSSEDDDVPPDQPNLKTGELKGQPGYGLVQWTFPPFKQAIRDIVTERRKTDPTFSAGNLQMQLDFLWSQLSTTYADLMSRMNADGVGAREAARLFLVEYERPSELINNARIRGDDAEAILLKYGSSITPGSPSTPITSGCGGGGAGGTVDIGGDKYAFPLSPQKHPISGITDNQTITTHHDETPAFDLYSSPGGHDPIYAIHDGIVQGAREINPGQCYSLNLVTQEADGEWHYWYGHIKELTVPFSVKGPDGNYPSSPDTVVKAGDQLGITSAGTENTGPGCFGGGGAHLHIDRGINHTPGGLVCFNQPAHSAPENNIRDCVNGTGRDAGFIILLGRIYAGLP